MKKHSAANTEQGVATNTEQGVATPCSANVKADANELLSCLREVTDGIADLEARANTEMAEVTARYGSWLNPLREELTARGKELIALMKKNKGLLFDGTDVVNLAHGSLIRNEAEKVSIPRDALEACKGNGFDDVIRVVESLDRPAIEKWPDAKLTLIGATRKPTEEFKYDLRK